MAKFGIKIGQIRPYNSTKKLKICLASYFGLKNSGFEISTISDHMIFLRYYFRKFSKMTQIGPYFKITKFFSQICSWNHFGTFWPTRDQVKGKAGAQYCSHGTSKKYFCKSPYGVPHTKISARKAKNFVLGDLRYDVFEKASLNGISKPLILIEVNNFH